MLRTGTVGSGFDAPTAAPVSRSQMPIRVEHHARPLQLLDDEHSTTKSAFASGPPVDEIDPLDAFMKSLDVPLPPPPPPPPKPVEVEIDPLDAFMASLEQTTTSTTTAATATTAPITPATASASAATSQRRGRLDLDDDSDVDPDEDDPMTSYLAAAEKAASHKRTRQMRDGADDGEDENEDEEVYRVAAEVDAAEQTSSTKRVHDIHLESIDHSLMKYPPFRKAFYKEHPELTSVSESEIKELTEDFDVQVIGAIQPRLCYRFAYFGFDSKLLRTILKQGYEYPTTIQAAAYPIIMSGHDLIGIAKTGSGKTCAFVWPLAVHLLDQPHLKPGEGPIGLILAPTRELSDQIYQEAYRYLRLYNYRVVPVIGGMQKYEQVRSLKSGCDVIVATPGRLLDLLQEKSVSLFHVTFLVLDEADRMFSLGFGQQLNQILSQIRPDRQFVLFSATMDGRVEKLARQHLNQPVRVKIGTGSNTKIRQVVDLLPTEDEKVKWLLSKLPTLVQAGSVLIFVSTRVTTEELAKKLAVLRIPLGTLHGDHHQAQRMEVLAKFKAHQIQILIATDVAARGLDIKGLPTVVCYDIARNSDTHTHRIGRTGRAGLDGVAYTLVTPADEKYAGLLYENLEASQQEIPPGLWELAMKNKYWSRGRSAAAMQGRLLPSSAVSVNREPPATNTPNSYPLPPPPPPPPSIPTPTGRAPYVFASNTSMPTQRPPPPPSSAVYNAMPPPSYNAVPPPSYNAVPPPPTIHTNTGAGGPISLAETIKAAHAKAAALKAGGIGHAPPSTPFQPSPIAAPTPVVTTTGGIHPSRMHLVPGAMNAQSRPQPPPPQPIIAHQTTIQHPPPSYTSTGTANSDQPPPKKSRWG